MCIIYIQGLILILNFFAVERDLKGNLLDEARCETCNGDSPAFSVPNIDGAQ